MPCAALAAPPAGETERRLKALTVKRKRKPVGGGGGEVFWGQHAFEGDASRAQALISVFRFHIFVAATHTHMYS